MITKHSTVLLVDDHPIVRQGLQQMIDREADLHVCGEAEEARSALHAIAVLKPDIVVMDISLNGPSGIEILRTIRQTDSKLRVLVLSMHDETVYAERALRAGANGYIMKQEATEKVLVAMRRILAGEVYVSDRVANKMLKQFVGGAPSSRHSPVDDLTDRELEVFRLIGEGHGTRQISDELHLSVKTVETYQAHIKEKMGLRNARELVQYAIQWAISENQSADNPPANNIGDSLIKNRGDFRL
jgi:DNA-binding NarL/FixJ family response regulator